MSRTDHDVPDRLADVLRELEVARRTPGWVPSEDLVPSRSSRRRRTAAAAVDASAGHADDKAAVLRIPTAFRGAEIGASRRAILGVVALACVALILFGGRVLLAQAQAQPHQVSPTGNSAVAAASPVGSSNQGGSPSAPSSPSSSAGAPSAKRTAAGTAAAGSGSGSVIHVVGQVKHPGVYKLPAGARVEDAVSAAGGPLPGADLSAVNLARVIADADQVHIPRPGEIVNTVPSAPAPNGSGVAPSAGATVTDLNSADEAALDGLPGVGPVLAQRILQWRATNGRFTAVDELGEVSGIGDKLLSQLRPLVRVG